VPNITVATHLTLPAHHSDHRNARACRLRRRDHQCSSRGHSLQGGRLFLRPLFRSAHLTAISSSMIPGRRDAEGLDLTCILYLHRLRPLLKVVMKAGRPLSGAPGARRNRLSDQ
jgi:hypothetical protein